MNGWTDAPCTRCGNWFGLFLGDSGVCAACEDEPECRECQGRGTVPIPCLDGQDIGPCPTCEPGAYRWP